uniref:RNA-directed DNA polymerase n=1 Tax=Globodera rostochiensis TaxID=31243 RepID=A0A914I8D8_GLORO
MASFYRRHIPNFSTIVEPLTRLSKKEKKFTWDKEQEGALSKIKELMSQTPILAFPDYSIPFHIFTDASVVGQGAALMQKKGDLFSAIAYASRTLSATERRWPPVQIELGAIVFALRTFKPYIYMSAIELHTDHRPLAYLQSKAQQHAHLARWLVELQNFNIKIVHISGKKNALADALSRLSESNLSPCPEDTTELQDIVEFPVCLSLTPFDRIVHNFDPIACSLTIRTTDGTPHQIIFPEYTFPYPFAHSFLTRSTRPSLEEVT